MASKKREYREMVLQVEKRDETEGNEGEPSYKVSGYASTFDTYKLFNCDGIDYFERIDPHAFDGADLSDVVFRVDHEGPVYARTSGGTLSVDTDEHGLKISADLGKTQNARNLYEDIAAGNYPKMSFAFTVREDSYDKQEHTRNILKIDKVYDVSPVSFPANDNTELSISERAFFDGVIEKQKAERLFRKRVAATIKKELLKSKLEDQLNDD